MSLRLPTLDDRSYDDLLEEVRALIPASYPVWTDHNPADPGITLVELLAWLTEMLLYRIDRLPDSYRLGFLRILNGPEWPASGVLEDDIRLTIEALGQQYRAVTLHDYEVLACAAAAGVARSRCVARSDLPGYVSLIVVPDPQQEGAATLAEPPLPSQTLLDQVKDYLEPRRLLTVRHHVAGPMYAPVQLALDVVRYPEVPAASLHAAITRALFALLDPLTGGESGTGWPFGRHIYLSQLYNLLEGVEGVDYITRLVLTSHRPTAAAWCVEAREIRRQEEMVGLMLEEHHLPWLTAVEVAVRDEVTDGD